MSVPKVKHFDEAQVYAAGMRASKLLKIEQEARAALRRGDRVTLLVNGVPVVTLE